MGNCFGSSSSVKPLSPASTNTISSGPSTSESSTNSNSEQYVDRIADTDEEVFPAVHNVEVRGLRVYTLAELKMATENFNPQALVRVNDKDRVYRGWVDPNTLNPAVRGHGRPVAVKRYFLENIQGLQEWLCNIEFLGRIVHPNVVKLLGCCRKDRELLLVYEYVPLGSLDNHLFGSNKPLSWSQRLKIAIGAARGLAFLHTSDKQVIYRDFKTSNILLNSKYEPKLCDFGLATNGPTSESSHVATKLKGTYEYAAPEYIFTGHLYVKSDVYGFGVVLLEILSGLRAFDSKRPNEQQLLVNWAKPFLSDSIKLTRVMDPMLKGQYPSKGALQVAQLALRCLEHDCRSRPSMKEVVETLERIEAMKMREMVDGIFKGGPRNHGQDVVSHPLPLPPKHDNCSSGARGVHHSPRVRWHHDL